MQPARNNDGRLPVGYQSDFRVPVGRDPRTAVPSSRGVAPTAHKVVKAVPATVVPRTVVTPGGHVLVGTGSDQPQETEVVYVSRGAVLAPADKAPTVEIGRSAVSGQLVARVKK